MTQNFKMLFAALVTVLLLISIFATMMFTGMIDLDATSTQAKKRPIFIKIFVDESTGTGPFAVNFTSLVLYNVGDVSYNWDFGDGNTSDKINPTYTYQINGTFNCSLTVTDDAGEKASDVKDTSLRVPSGISGPRGVEGRGQQSCSGPR